MSRPLAADLSVLTIASGRPRHLANLLRGLAQQTLRPRELVLGVMQPEPYALPHTPFPVRQVRLAPAPELPLAAARNAAARAAEGAVLAFLDVDCIPAPTFVADYARAAKPGAGLFMGEVLYLPAGAADPGWSYAAFDRVAERHSDRRGPPAHGAEPCADYRCFWSLNFALAARDFRRSPGFDERFAGYGGEDTDFAKGFTMAGGRLSWLRGAKVYHQHHAHAMPPIHHMDSVLANAERFREKWGYRTMEHWLYAFELMGLIARDREVPGEAITVLRRPDDADRALCAQGSDMPYANTTRVIRRLQERAAGRALSDDEAVPAMRAAQGELLGGARGDAAVAAE
jgi:GT2 family glycosyltransferase